MNVVFKTKQILSGVLDFTGFLDARLMHLRPKIIFCYHRVLPEVDIAKNISQDSMWVSTANFEKQIQWMRRIGKITTIEELVTAKTKPSEPTFALTFDDGWKDNYEQAFPILKKYNLPAMIFLSTNAIETNKMFWPEELFYKTNIEVRANHAQRVIDYLTSHEIMSGISEKRNIDHLLNMFIEKLKLLDTHDRNKMISNYYDNLKINPAPIRGHILSWDDVRKMKQHNITFGSHTHSHMITKGANKSTILEELGTSKKILEERLGTECKWFCYPNARFNEDDHFLLRQAGFDYGVILHSQPLREVNSSFYLPRFIMYEDISKVLGLIKLRLLGVPFF